MHLNLVFVLMLPHVAFLCHVPSAAPEFPLPGAVCCVLHAACYVFGTQRLEFRSAPAGLAARHMHLAAALPSLCTLKMTGPETRLREAYGSGAPSFKVRCVGGRCTHSVWLGVGFNSLSWCGVPKSGRFVAGNDVVRMWRAMMSCGRVE